MEWMKRGIISYQKGQTMLPFLNKLELNSVCEDMFGGVCH